jgi:hypothetical protein
MTTSDIDLNFRPLSYFWPLGLASHLLATVKGAERRAMLQRLIDSDRLDLLTECLTKSHLSREERTSIGRIHPMFMGGEYLPSFRQSEVEIARIHIESTTGDVTSVFARRGKGRIYYRVVDEYGGDTLSGQRKRSSLRPLSLSQLYQFFIGAWPLLDVLEMNFGNNGYDIGRMLAFVNLSSAFYPQFGMLCRQRITAWGDQMRFLKPPRPSSAVAIS